jgi:YidB-like protein
LIQKTRHLDSIVARALLVADFIDVLQILSQVLPNTVDRLTPQGRLPTKQEIAQFRKAQPSYATLRDLSLVSALPYCGMGPTKIEGG